MKKEDNNAEQRLLNSASLDELIKMKMEEEMKKELLIAEKIPEKTKETDIKKVPQELIFSKKATYRLFNRTNKTETFINGVQAEAMLGLQNNLREKVKKGESDAFSTDSAYVRFECVEL